MAFADLGDWLTAMSRGDALWYVKRLAANDTLATKSHQAGPYVPKDFLFNAVPELNRPDVKNPDTWFSLNVDSHNEQAGIRAVWYNNRLSGGTRNETRLTNFGGSSSALLDPESTGSLAAFVFRTDHAGTSVRVWVARTSEEEDRIENVVGPVEPDRGVFWSASPQALLALRPVTSTPANCALSRDEIPAGWLTEFPSGVELIRKAIELRPATELGIDARILRRRDCEYELFRSVEEVVELPRIREGFESVESFVARAQSILQRRKARAGRSLELHAREILLEEGFEQDRSFAWGTESEPGRRPDFLFPSVEAYRNPGYPTRSLRMLAAKTTCKDRWRQILNEADRIGTKHLLTLQEGVSANQFREMTEAGVKLVVPRALHRAFPEAVRPHLMTLRAFVDEVRDLSLPG